MPTSIETIVVGYDGFERDDPLPTLAVALAHEHGANLRLVHVADEPPRHGWWSKNSQADELYQSTLDIRRERLEALLSDPRETGIAASSEIRQGVPHVELIRAAMTADADLVIVADQCVHRRGRPGFGTVTMKLLRFCPMPVLAKRDLSQSKHQNIVAALDLAPSPDGAGLNAAVLDMAAALARRSAGKLTLFHAWELWGEETLKSRALTRPKELAEMAAETRRDREHEAKRLVASLGADCPDVDIELRKGDPWIRLPEFVKEHDVDIVVMGTLDRTGLQGLLMGNTAERILNELNCSVLAIKPRAFRSPIEP